MAKAPAGPPLSLEEQAGWFSHILSLWVTPLLKLGQTRQLQMEDLGAPYTTDRTDFAYATLRGHWDEELKLGKRASFFRATRRTVGLRLWLTAVALRYVSAALNLCRPMVIRYLIAYLTATANGPSVSTGEAWFLVACLFVLPTAEGFIEHTTEVWLMHGAFRMRKAVQAAIFQKVLRLTPSARAATSRGHIVTLMSTDAARMQMLIMGSSRLMVLPPVVVVGVILLFQQMEIATLAGLAVLVVSFPISGLLMLFVRRMHRAVLKAMDERVRITNEILLGIDVIKYYGWERAFAATIEKIRGREIKLLRNLILAFAAGLQNLLSCASLIMTVAVFAVFTQTLGLTLDPARAFASLLIFGIIQTAFLRIPMIAVNQVQSLLSLRRIGRFLLLPEVAPEADAQRLLPKDASPWAIELHEFCARWVDVDNDPKTTTASPAQVQLAISEPAATTTPSPSNPPAEVPMSPRPVQDAQTATVEDVAKSQNDTPRPTSPASATSTPAPFQLSNISLRIPHGELVAVVGSVGSGKSSLVSALLGDMQPQSGHVKLAGTVAYVPQRPWIENATLRDNVIFGMEYKEDWYMQVVAACCLDVDVRTLTGGHDCEIGEQGINLSGGQKARVALARAVYTKPDVIILDDVLAAVDAHVAEALFNKCIKGACTQATRFMVMNQVHFLPFVDRVVVLRDGAVTHCGTYAELVAAGLNFTSLVDTSLEEAATEDTTTVEASEQAPEAADGKADQDAGRPKSRSRSQSAAQRGRQPSQGGNNEADAAPQAARKPARSSKHSAGDGDGKLVEEEQRAKGLVGSAVYWFYMRAAGWWGIGAVLGIFLSLTLGTVNSFVLGAWTSLSVSSASSSTLSTFLAVYVAVGMGGVVMTSVSNALAGIALVQAGKKLHERLLTSVMNAPMSFFDVTPTGRVMNRFSQDIHQVDIDAGRALLQLVGASLGLVVTLGSIAVATKGIMLAVLVPVLLAYWWVMRFCRLAMLESERLASVSRSPVFAHFSETLTGIATIRAFARQDAFFLKSGMLQDAATVASSASKHIHGWMTLRLAMLSSIVSLAVAVIAMVVPGMPISFMAVALTQAFSITDRLSSIVEALTTCESGMNAVQRVQEYAISLPQESTVDAVEVPDSWPATGAVEFRNLSVRYRDNPLVLHDVSLSIRDKEKIGVAGRTGSGKSTLMAALFRIIPADSGAIFIDGVDISHVDLFSLRSRLGIIPQEPVLFAGTLRYNLDPFEQCTDAALWDALSRVQLSDVVSNLPKQLQFQVAEGGENLSVGQRQLLCMARAILRSPKVLVLDEATASVDNGTDNLVQRMIRTTFKESTILTIAHRLNTIMDSDRILVLDHGNVAECAPPAELLARPSMFKSMVTATTQASS